MSWRVKEGGQLENPEPGSHIARCISLIDLGTQHHNGFNGGQPWSSRDVRIIWELPFQKMEGIYKPELKGRMFRVSATLKQSLFSTSKLRRFLESWRGSQFSKADIESFDLKTIIGRSCRLTLVERNGYVNVEGVAPLNKGEQCPKQTYASVLFSLEDFDNDVYDGLSDNLKKKIAASPEFKALSSGSSDPAAEYDVGDSGYDPGDDVPF